MLNPELAFQSTISSGSISPRQFIYFFQKGGRGEGLFLPFGILFYGVSCVVQRLGRNYGMKAQTRIQNIYSVLGELPR